MLHVMHYWMHGCGGRVMFRVMFRVVLRVEFMVLVTCCTARVLSMSSKDSSGQL